MSDSCYGFLQSNQGLHDQVGTVSLPWINGVYRNIQLVFSQYLIDVVHRVLITALVCMGDANHTGHTFMNFKIINQITDFLP